MKALSIRQPYAAAIVDGEKTVELRTWQTPYRGDLLICASGAKTGWGKKEDDEFGIIYGHAIGVATLTDIVPFSRDLHGEAAWVNEDDDLPEKLFAWILEDAFEIIPFPVKGKLHIFEVDIPEETK